MLDGAPLPANASIKVFQQGKAGFMANIVEQALLLPDDMADLRSMRRHEVFLSLKRNLAMVSLSISLFFFINFYFLNALTLLLFLPFVASSSFFF